MICALPSETCRVLLVVHVKGVTMELNDFLQVNKDVSDVLWREDAVSVQPLVEHTVQHLQHPQVSTLSVEQLWGRTHTYKIYCTFLFNHFDIMLWSVGDSPLMTSCRLISCGVKLARTPRLTRLCQFWGFSSHSISPPWSSSLWMSAEFTGHCTSILLTVRDTETLFIVLNRLKNVVEY